VAIERLLDRAAVLDAPDALYMNPRWPVPPADRPYTSVNMVSTVDGKILLGPRGSTAKGLGGQTDQLLMRRLESAADGAMIGAGTLRAGPVIYASHLWRATVTRSGDLPIDNRFFTDAPEKAIVFAPATLASEARIRLETCANVRFAGETEVDLTTAVHVLRTEFGIRHLIVEGGPDLNFDLFEAGIVDELFLTFAPKLKGGAGVPTILEGPGLPDRDWIGVELLSLYHDGDELYFRYRIGPRHEG